MSSRVLLGALAAVVLGVGLVGCTKPAVREKPIADPLLVSKKPVEGKPHLAVSRGNTTDDFPPPPPPPPPSQPSARLQAPRPAR